VSPKAKYTKNLQKSMKKLNLKAKGMPIQVNLLFLGDDEPGAGR
jgi:hypothetical protein